MDRWPWPRKQAPRAVTIVKQRLQPFLTKWNQPDLQVLKELIEAGTVTPVIDRTYTLSEALEAMRYLERGHARGKIVLTV